MRRRWGRLLLAAIAFALALIVLLRQPIAEGIGQIVCSQQKLNCILKISRLDFGGLTLRDVTVRNPAASNPALTLRRLAIDFDWKSPFSPTVRWLGGDEVVVRVDLSGARPMLGDLDATVKRFSGKGGEPGPMPRIDLRNIRIIGDTPLGPVEARGSILAENAQTFTIDMTAPAAKLSFPGGEIDLREAELHARAANGGIAGAAKFNLVSFKAGDNITMSDLKLDLAIDQAAGVLTGKGAASVGEINLPDTRVGPAQAQADLESPAVDLEQFSLGAWLPGVRRLDLLATSGAGTVSGVSWKQGEARANLAPRAGATGSQGAATFFADGITMKEGTADRLELQLDLYTASGGEGEAMNARGVARLRNAALSPDARNQLATLVSAPLEASLPNFATAAGGAMRRAGQGFNVLLPLAGAVNDDGYVLQALSGVEITAGSGLSLVADSEGGKEVVRWSSGRTVDWTAAGSARLQGGGAPPIDLQLTSAAGDGKKTSLAGTAELRSWRVGDDVLAAKASGLRFDTNDTGGSAAGEMTAQLSGGLAGGVWTRARASGAVDATWTPDGFVANAPRGLTVAWDQAKYGGMTIGAGTMTYKPNGKLVESVGDAILGSGAIDAFGMPVTGDNFSADVKVGPTALTWATQGQLKISFDADPAEVVMHMQDQEVPLRLDNIIGFVELVEGGWRVSGSADGGTAKSPQAEFADLKGRFDLSGSQGHLNGKLADVSMRIFDPYPKDQRRYEETTFLGSATLSENIANFSGDFALKESGVQLGAVSGRHSLETGSGSLAFAPVPLIFAPRVFEPKALSPFLRGPANVTGRVDVSGGASWSPEGLKANATLEMRKINFTLAQAGVFEGVSGKVVVDDLLNLKSSPGQSLSIDKVTLGMPIEKGVVKFQLIGFDAIRIEGAEWPFVGGFIRIKPADFVYGAEENRIVAQAVDWDLTKLVELFKIPDVKIAGKAGGDVPVVFSTGSARLVNAVLEASTDGGVIQYTGAASAAAGDNEYSKALFEALKDFRYRVLRVQLDGDLAGRIIVSMKLFGKNPEVWGGATFDLGISIDSELMQLLNMASTRPEVSAVVDLLQQQDRN